MKFREFWAGVWKAATDSSHTDPMDVIAACFILGISLTVAGITIFSIYEAITN